MDQVFSLIRKRRIPAFLRAAVVLHAFWPSGLARSFAGSLTNLLDKGGGITAQERRCICPFRSCLDTPSMINNVIGDKNNGNQKSRFNGGNYVG